MGEFQRWNTHHSHVVPIEVCGQQLNIAQDPTSDNLGTTIWDASIILVRYMERNPHLYSRQKLAGKRVLELGAGCGLAGMYFSLQGAHVTFTDLVVEYCWGTSLDALAPPYDFVVACDCVYVERLVDVLVSSMVRLSGRSTTVLVASEKREELTYARFRERLARDFTVRQAPRRHMDKAHDHENSEVLLCKLRRPAKDPRSKSRSEGSLTQEVVPGGNRTAGEGLAARDLACGDQERREKRDGPPSVAAGAEPPHPGTPSNTLALDVHKKRTTNPDDGVDLSLDSVRLGSPRVVDGSQPGGSPGEAPATLDERPER